jgi:hypothetical protein
VSWVRALGVTCNPPTAYLTLAIDGTIMEAQVERVEVAAQYEASAELLSTLDEIKRAFGQLRPDIVALLMPEQGRHKRTYQEIAPRVALETLVRIAAVQENINIEVLARPTLRARLGIPKAGELSSHVSGCGVPLFDRGRWRRVSGPRETARNGRWRAVHGSPAEQATIDRGRAEVRRVPKPDRVLAPHTSEQSVRMLASATTATPGRPPGCVVGDLVRRTPSAPDCDGCERDEWLQ